MNDTVAPNDRTRSARSIDVGLAAAAFLIDGLVQGLNPTLDVSAAGVLVLTGVVLGSAALLVRRRAPLPVFAIWWVIGFTPLLISGHEPAAGIIIALITVSSRLPIRTAVLTGIATLVPFTFNALDAAARQRLDPASSVLLAVVWLLIALAAVGIGRVIRLLRDQQDLQQRLHAAELSTVIRDERLRLARDLHDVVAHSVSAMILQAAGARSLDDRTDERIKDALRSVETTGADAMRELHRLLGLLRSPSDDPPPLTAQPGIDDLDQVIGTTRACGVEVTVDESGERRPLDPQVSYTAFRMVQECMANVIKHGGAGADCTLRIAWHEDGVDITVRSDEHDAVNASTLSGGYGLRGLTERVQQVGGRFDAGPEAESIFVASMSLPFRPRAAVAGG